MRHIQETRAFVDFVKLESVLLGLQLKHENSTGIANSITVHVIIIFLTMLSVSHMNTKHQLQQQTQRTWKS
jgi:hypothetical protein